MAEVSTPIGTTDESRRHLLEQFAERLSRRGDRQPDVSAVVSAARAEAFLNDLRAEHEAVDDRLRSSARGSQSALDGLQAAGEDDNVS